MLTIIDGFAVPASHPSAIPSPRVGVLERAARTQVPCPRWRLAGDGRTSAEAADEGNLLSTKVGGDLRAFFAPQTVAVIGATEKPGSVGRTILWNLISSPFGGAVFPVNPKRWSVLGIKAHPAITDIPAQVDLIVVCTPAPSV